MAIKKYVLDPDQELTNEQILMIREAAKHPVVTDDNPELTDEQLALMALGKGYSGILSRIVESILNDPAELSKYL